MCLVAALAAGKPLRDQDVRRRPRDGRGPISPQRRCCWRCPCAAGRGPLAGARCTSQMVLGGLLAAAFLARTDAVMFCATALAWALLDAGRHSWRPVAVTSPSRRWSRGPVRPRRWARPVAPAVHPPVQGLEVDLQILTVGHTPVTPCTPGTASGLTTRLIGHREAIQVDVVQEGAEPRFPVPSCYVTHNPAAGANKDAQSPPSPWPMIPSQTGRHTQPPGTSRLITTRRRRSDAVVAENPMGFADKSGSAYRARWRRRASSRSAMTAGGTTPTLAPRRSIATARTCSACALESRPSPVSPAGRNTWNG